MIGIRNGTEIGYNLREVAEMVGQWDADSAEGCALIQKLGEYFRRERLVELYSANSYDVVSGGAIRAYCYDHDLNVPPAVAGTRPSAEEMPAHVRKMWRDREAISGAAPELMPSRAASSVSSGRRHGGARPEVEYIERYVSACQQRGLTLLAMKNGLVRHVRECIDAEDSECPFIDYDPIRSIFTVWGASGSERELSLESVRRSIRDAGKRISKRQQLRASVPPDAGSARNNSGVAFFE